MHEDPDMPMGVERNSFYRSGKCVYRKVKEGMLYFLRITTCRPSEFKLTIYFNLFTGLGDPL
jgi:hypothetical protein